MNAPQRHPDDQRKRIEADGAHGVVEIARKLLGDVRVAPLVLDLNPELRPTGPVRAGVLVTLPSRNQVRAFARRHGFTLGFDERAANGTDARKKWAVLAGDAAKPTPTVAPLMLAQSLLARGVSLAEVARRVHRQCPGAELATLADARDARLPQVATLVEAHRLVPAATSRLCAARALLDATSRPGGLRAFLEGAARDADGARALLARLLVAAPLIDALIEAAPRVSAQLRDARAIAGMERGAQDARTKADPVQRALVAALVDGVEPLAGARLALVGLEAEALAFDAHMKKLSGALRQATDGLARVQLQVLRACVGAADGAGLARPWPLVARVAAALSEASARVGVTRLDLGLGGLIASSSESQSSSASGSGAAIVPLAVLQARASTCARVDDEGEAVAARLAKHVVALFDAMRPRPVLDGGPPQTRRARRRAAFDLAVTARGPVSAAGVAALCDEALDAARACGIGRGERVTPQQREAVRMAAGALVGALSVARRPMSELGRALVVTAMAIEPELAHGLARPTGQEAFVQTAAKHAARVLSAAACQIC